METLSPMTTLSPMAPDVEMESPKGQSEELQARQETGMIGRSNILRFNLCLFTKFATNACCSFCAVQLFCGK